MIDVYDDVLSPQDAEYISAFIKAKHFMWNYYHVGEKGVDIIIGIDLQGVMKTKLKIMDFYF